MQAPNQQTGQWWRCVRLMSGMLMTSGCLSVPLEQSHQELETQVTAVIEGIDTLPRHAPGDRDTSTRVKVLLADDLTAETAVRIALWHNRRIQAEYARLDRAAAERLDARLLKNPQMHGSMIYSDESSSNKVFELGVEVDLLHMLLLPKRRRLGDAKYETVKLDVARAVQRVAYETRVACHRLLAAQQQLGMRESVLHAADAARDMAQRLRDAGNIRELEKLTQEALYEQAALGVSAAELAVEEAREKLNVLMGLTGDDTLWRMSGELKVRADLETYDDPGPYAFPAGTVSRKATAAELESDGITVDMPAERKGMNGHSPILHGDMQHE